MRPVRVFHLDLGGCGACAAEVWAAVEGAKELARAAAPSEADVVALTGSVTPLSRPAVQALWDELWTGHVPLVAVGRCAIDGYPFGQGGLGTLPEVVAQAKITACPPQPELVVQILLQAVGREHLWNRR